MEKIANDVYQETKCVLSRDEIQTDLKRLVDILVDKEVIYELS